MNRDCKALTLSLGLELGASRYERIHGTRQLSVANAVAVAEDAHPLPYLLFLLLMSLEAQGKAYFRLYRDRV